MPAREPGPPFAWRSRIARLFVRREGPLGHCDKWKDGERRTGARNSRYRFGENNGDHQRSRPVRQAEPRPLYRSRRQAGGAHWFVSRGGGQWWDLLAARRAAALGIGLLSGGYGRDELEKAGAYRVYQDPADMLQHLDEVGVRRAESI